MLIAVIVYYCVRELTDDLSGTRHEWRLGGGFPSGWSLIQRACRSSEPAAPSPGIAGGRHGGALPLSFAFWTTDAGKQWSRKATAWLVAFTLYKPAAAIVYATAFQLMSSAQGDAMLNVFTGMTLMFLAVLALPALMRFVSPHDSRDRRWWRGHDARSRSRDRGRGGCCRQVRCRRWAPAPELLLVARAPRVRRVRAAP